MKLIDYKICNSDKVYEGYLTPRMMCAGYLQGGKDACQVSRGTWPLPGKCCEITGPPAFPTHWCPLPGYEQRDISCLLTALPLCARVTAEGPWSARTTAAGMWLG